jgi:hypothetical protein
MADQQESSPQAQTEQSPDSPQFQDSQDNYPQELSPELSEDNSGEAGSGDEIADALAAVKDLDLSDENEGSEGTEVPARESKAGQSESQAKEEGASAPAETDKVKPSALASFHRQQKELFQAQQAVKAKEAEYARVMGIIENAKSDRLAALELMGYTDTKEFLQSIAEDGGRESPERKQIRELQKWKAEQETARQKQQEQFQAEQQQQAVQAKVDAIRSEVQNTLKSESYRDGLLALSGSDENVMTEMDRMATETGEMPRIEDAIKAVEGRYRTYLEEMVSNPAVVRFFEEKLRSTKLASNGAPQSKPRAKHQTIDSAVRGPGTRVSGRPTALDDEDAVMAEAMSFLKAQGL